jgi:hypothetical protein
MTSISTTHCFLILYCTLVLLFQVRCFPFFLYINFCPTVSLIPESLSKSESKFKHRNDDFYGERCLYQLLSKVIVHHLLPSRLLWQRSCITQPAMALALKLYSHIPISPASRRTALGSYMSLRRRFPSRALCFAHHAQTLFSTLGGRR